MDKLVNALEHKFDTNWAPREEFTKRVGEFAFDLLKEVKDGDIDELMIRAFLVAEFCRVGILDASKGVMEEAMGYVMMRGAGALDVCLEICEEMWGRGADEPAYRIPHEEGEFRVCAELWVKAGL
ncbi:hypothetical protein DFP72DRAFT_1050033 [Ephemerocybe angulata]|uniref:Uncharacterized protein n=1 Tax=Ephemerocybe angulata TaxID=980116 RepID=A0A8H6M0X1_9AGAR|nr:hypothetical protein DFP72DRAFT_1050033 [Tulosesus angulatus]